MITKLFSKAKWAVKDIVGGRGERQVARSDSGIRADHIARYEVASEFIGKDARVLDAACGIGYGCKFMAEHSPCKEVTGVDISRRAILFAKMYYRHSKVSFVRADCQVVSLHCCSYDVITSFETLEHVQDPVGLLKRFNTWLKGGGILLFSTPNELHLPHSPECFPHHVRHFEPEELVELLRQAKLDIVSVMSQPRSDSKEVIMGWDGLFTIVVCRKRRDRQELSLEESQRRSCGRNGSDEEWRHIADVIRQSAKRGGQIGSDKLLEAAPVRAGQRIIDIGMGTGEATRFFLSRGLVVAATCRRAKEFGVDCVELVSRGVQIVDCVVEELPFDSEVFDACWMSHVLEHTMNPGKALESVWRILKPGGWLFVVVPPYKSRVVGGHLMTGWNIGQLMYVLVVNGFDIRHGHFVKEGNNICGFVRKRTRMLPYLHSDIGDIEALTNYWPVVMFQGAEGDIDSINWPPQAVGTVESTSA